MFLLGSGRLKIIQDRNKNDLRYFASAEAAIFYKSRYFCNSNSAGYAHGDEQKIADYRSSRLLSVHFELYYLILDHLECDESRFYLSGHDD